jgi:hypothetical protein
MLTKAKIVFLLLICTPLSDSASAGDFFAELTNFQAKLKTVQETIGVGLVSTKSVRELVPDAFQLVGEGTPLTPIVVRTARSEIAVDGQRSRLGTIVQIGAIIAPPDGTGDINNFTLLYYTDDLKLAIRLLLSGVKAQYSPTLKFQRGNDGAFQVKVRMPSDPQFTVEGTVTQPAPPVGSFVANWWDQSFFGSTKMTTNVPSIAVGGADLELKTSRYNQLGQLIGSDTLNFPIIQQYNAFPDATLTVELLKP